MHKSWIGNGAIQAYKQAMNVPYSCVVQTLGPLAPVDSST
jgi:hypothetical protein